MNFDFNSPMILIAIAGAAVGLLFYYFYYHKKQVVTESEAEETPENKPFAFAKEGILCRVADNVTGRIYDAFITEQQEKDIIAVHKTLGRQWYRDNKWVYGINKYEDAFRNIKLKPIITPSQIKHPPSELHYDIKQPEVGIVVSESLKEDKSFIEEYGHYLWLILALAFLMFMWTQS